MPPRSTPTPSDETPSDETTVEQPSPAGWVAPTLSPSPDDDFVPARWVHVQAHYSPAQGLIRYGDPFWVSAEQLDHDDRVIAWSDQFTPDPTSFTISRQEG